MPEKLILFCGPSGSGKTSIVQYLLGRIPELAFSVSATTRARRDNETEGKDYYFISVEAFKRKIDADAFLEWEEVYENGYYGTLRSEVTRITGAGKAPIFDVDVEGGLKIKSAFRDALLDVFVQPPDIDELKKRLVARATESEESLKARVAKAVQELTYARHFSHTIVNREFESAAHEAEMLVRTFLAGVPQEGRR
jgi:guanylate kinase